MGQRFYVTMTVDTDDLPTRITLENEIKNALDLGRFSIWVRDIDVSQPEPVGDA